MSTDEIIVLLAIGMILQILGTASVAINYFRGAELAKKMHDKITTVQLASNNELDSLAYQLHSDDPVRANAAVKKVGEQATKLIDEAIRHLGARWYLTLGLICYSSSAVLEFAAGVGALNGR